MLNSFLLVTILQLCGAGIIIAEFVVPSGGLLSLAAMSCIGYSVYHVFTEISPKAGIFVILSDVIIIPASVIIGIKMLANSPATLKQKLSSKDGVTSQDSNLTNLVGKSGTVLSDLRPAGKISVGDSRYDVISGGDFIPKDSEVIISEVNSNRIIVKKL